MNQTPEPDKFDIGDVLVDKSTGEKAIIMDRYVFGAAWKSYFDVMVMNAGTFKAFSIDQLDDRFQKVQKP